MDTDHSGWEVIDEELGVFTREYSFVKGAFARMMTARMKDGRLLAASPAPGLPEAALRALDRWGGVGAIVATNGFHHLGVPTWKAAFPQARVYAPREAHARLRKKQPGLAELLPLEELAPLLPAEVKVRDVPGVKLGETWVQVATSRGSVWYVSDSCFSMKHPPDRLLPRLLFRWTDSAPGFRINGLGLKFLMRDRPAYRRWVLQELERELPRVVVTAHGSVVDDPGAGAELRRMAEARL
jgi:glyoxylase-like metal-dependent hydrolase (beta-lactamase superfamily II)